MHRWLAFSVFALALACGHGGDGTPMAMPPPPGGGTFKVDPVATGLALPTAMALAPDGRVFVCEQGGTLRVVKNGALLSAPFLSLTVDAADERGLIGVTLDPAFQSNGFIYVHYTVPGTTSHNRISRFTASGDLAQTGSERVVLDLDPLSTAFNHNGGALHFGPDGRLYAGVGDNANGANAQDLGTLKGKLLRMNPDGSAPADNPLLAQTSGKNQLIWALGLRNPFTFAFQPGTGLLYINDVGLSSWEEIDQGQAGANYGWPATEGATSDPAYVSPRFTYPHSGGPITGCAIAGGAFYDPATPAFPAVFLHQYLFMDLCGGWIRVLDPASGTVADWLTGFSSPVDLRVAADGSVFVLSHGDGTLKRVTYAP